MKKISPFISTLSGIIIFLLCLWCIGIPSLSLDMLKKPYWLPAIFTLIGGMNFLVNARWCITSRCAGAPLPFFRALCVTSFSSMIGAILPQGMADIAGRGPWAAKTSKCGLLNATNIILCDRLMDLYILFLLILPALIYYYAALSVFHLIVLTLMLLICGFIAINILNYRFFVIFKLLFDFVKNTVNAIPFLKKHIAFNTDILPINFEPKVFLIIYIISIVKYTLMVICTYGFFAITDTNVSLSMIFFFLPITQFIFILAFTPGAMGFIELGWAGLLTKISLPDNEIGLFLISQRFLNTLGLCIWGICALLCLNFIKTKNIQ